MKLEYHYLYLALKLFPHSRGRIEGPSNYVPGCQNHSFALDKSPDGKRYRIRCVGCLQGLMLPPDIDWRLYWRDNFTNDAPKMGANGSGLGAKPSNPAGSRR